MENEQHYVVINGIKWRFAIKCYPLTGNYFLKFWLIANQLNYLAPTPYNLDLEGKAI